MPAEAKARELVQLVREFRTSFGMERSIRLSRRSVLANRFLLSLAKTRIPGDPDTRILSLCRRIEMPSAGQAEVVRHLPSTRFVHIGFEQSEASCVYKLYLESGLPAGGATGSAPVLLHRAIKWDAADSSRSINARYLWYPGLTRAEIGNRITEMLGGGSAIHIAHGVLRMAPEAISRKLRYLEVLEDDNKRRSFDLNLYDAGLRIGDLNSFLLWWACLFDLDASGLNVLFDQIGCRALGHLSGGIHRDGEEFFSIYYGVEGCAG